MYYDNIIGYLLDIWLNGPIASGIFRNANAANSRRPLNHIKYSYYQFLPLPTLPTLPIPST